MLLKGKSEQHVVGKRYHHVALSFTVPYKTFSTLRHASTIERFLASQLVMNVSPLTVTTHVKKVHIHSGCCCLSSEPDEIDDK